MWQPSHAACLQTHLTSSRNSVQSYDLEHQSHDKHLTGYIFIFRIALKPSTLKIYCAAQGSRRGAEARSAGDGCQSTGRPAFCRRRALRARPGHGALVRARQCHEACRPRLRGGAGAGHARFPRAALCSPRGAHACSAYKRSC